MLEGKKTYIATALGIVFVVVDYVYGLNIAPTVASETADLAAVATEKAAALGEQVARLLDALQNLAVLGGIAALRHGVARRKD